MTETSTPAAATTRAAAYDLDVERIVLGSLMLSPSLIADIPTRLGGDHFYLPRHADLYLAIVNTYDANQPVEPVALAIRLAEAGDLDRLGGADYLHTCIAAVPTAANAGWYIDKMVEMADRRHLEAGGIRITHAATSPGFTTEDVAAIAEEIAQKALVKRGDNGMTQLGALIDRGLDEIEHRQAKPAGLPTGFRDLDRLLGGLRRKQLITVAAPTGAGKSVFLTDVARHIGIRHKLTVAMFSLEMDRDELFERIVSAEAGVPYHIIRDGNLDDRDWQRVSNVLGPMATAPLFICDESELNVRQIQAKCRGLANRHGLDAVIVDYTQLVQPSRNFSSDQERITDVSRALKVMAGNLNVPVICAAQMNRGPDMRADKLPQLQDLRGSGSIANDSNVVLFVHRPDYYDAESPRRGEADLVVRKARSAPKDYVTVAAQLDKSRFVDMAIPA